MRRYNLLLPSRGGKTASIQVGKITQYRDGDRYVYHYWAKPSEQRHSIHAWGLRDAVLARCRLVNVFDFVVYDKTNDVSYETTFEHVVKFGVRGKEDVYGGTINVPLEYWTQVPGKVPVLYVPCEDYVVLDPDATASFVVNAPPVRTEKGPMIEQDTLWKDTE